jgi:hypothetical protein
MNQGSVFGKVRDAEDEFCFDVTGFGHGDFLNPGQLRLQGLILVLKQTQLEFDVRIRGVRHRRAREREREQQRPQCERGCFPSGHWLKRSNRYALTLEYEGMVKGFAHSRQ